MTATLVIATITAIAAVGNPRPTPGSSKKIMLDAQIYVGSSNCESLLGTLSYFNSSDMVFRKDDVALYLLYATIAKMEDGAQIHPLADSKEKYDFIGDIQWIVPLTPPSSDCDEDTSFSIDPAQHAYLHISGAAVNCDDKEATFDVEIDQYISTLKDVKSSSSKFVTPFSCSIPDSPRYKTGKPVPYNRCCATIPLESGKCCFSRSANQCDRNDSKFFGYTFENASRWKGTDRLQAEGAGQPHNSNSSPRAT